MVIQEDNGSQHAAGKTADTGRVLISGRESSGQGENKQTREGRGKASRVANHLIQVDLIWSFR